jgi:flagellar biogenesis protein FliO
MEAGNQAMAVLLVMGLLAGMMWWLRKKGGRGAVAWPVRKRRGEGRLQAMERVQLSATHSVHLVRFGDRALLLAVSPAGVNPIEISSWSSLAGTPANDTEVRP